MHDIKALVGGNKRVAFTYYRAGNLWYTTESGFEFPVPVADCGEASFMANDKAILFLKWIRAHVAYANEAEGTK